MNFAGKAAFDFGACSPPGDRQPQIENYRPAIREPRVGSPAVSAMFAHFDGAKTSCVKVGQMLPVEGIFDEALAAGAEVTDVAPYLG